MSGMSKSDLSHSVETPGPKNCDENGTGFMTNGEGKLSTMSESSKEIVPVRKKDSNIYIDLTESSSQVVHALEEELNERRQKIVTSFQLRELSSASGFYKTNIKYFDSDDVVERKAEEHFLNGTQIKPKDEVKSISYLTKAISLRPMESKYYSERGECFLQICDFQSAILNYKKACILLPDNDTYYSRLAFIYYFQGQCLFDSKLYTEALESFSRAAEMKPDIVSYHIKSIACLAALQRHSECLTLVNKRLVVATQDADLLVMRAKLHQLFRNDTLCYYDIKDALKLQPHHSEAKVIKKHLIEKAENFKEQGVKHQLLGKIAEALLKFSNAIEANPENAQYHLFRGALHRQKSDFNSAIDDFLLAMDKRDHDYNDNIYKESERQLLLCYNDFAVGCFSKGLYEEAVVLLNKAIKEEKDEKGLYVNRGDCFLKMLEFDFALSDYSQALELDQNDQSIKIRISFVYNELGLLSYNDKRYAESFDYFDLAIQSNPKVAAYYASRARARYMLKDYENAKFDVGCTIVLEPNNRSIMSLEARLFPQQSVEDILQTPTGILASQFVEKSIKKAFESPPWLHSKERKGSKDLSSKLVLPPIPDQKLKRCLLEEDFVANQIQKKQVSDKVKKALTERKSLEYKGPRISSKTLRENKTSTPGRFGQYSFGKTSHKNKPIITQRARLKGENKVLAFMQA